MVLPSWCQMLPINSCSRPPHVSERQPNSIFHNAQFYVISVPILLLKHYSISTAIPCDINSNKNRHKHSDQFIIISHSLPQHRTYNHLKIFQKRRMTIIIKIYPHLIWKYHLIIILFRIRNPSKNCFLVTIFQ